MELIDKKQAMNHIENEYRMWGDHYDAYQIIADIEDMPTVDAVPVEWLYDLADKKEEEKDIKLSAMIKGVVALWHREQEKENG